MLQRALASSVAILSGSLKIFCTIRYNRVAILPDDVIASAILPVDISLATTKFHKNPFCVPSGTSKKSFSTKLYHI